MKITKDIAILIEKRRIYGELAREYDEKVQTWGNQNGVDLEIVSLENGGLLTADPDELARLTKLEITKPRKKD